jgi:hypothetical protein
MAQAVGEVEKQEENETKYFQNLHNINQTNMQYLANMNHENNHTILQLIQHMENKNTRLHDSPKDKDITANMTQDNNKEVIPLMLYMENINSRNNFSISEYTTR